MGAFYSSGTAFRGIIRETELPRDASTSGAMVNLTRRLTMENISSRSAGRKTCTKCGETKPYSEFHKNKKSADGYRWRCKPCRSRMPDWRRENIELEASGRRRCRICDAVKNLEKFQKDKNASSGHTNRCKKCCRHRSKKWYQNNIKRARIYRRKQYRRNPEEYKRKAKKWRDENKEHARKTGREWRANNREKKRQYNKRWYQENRQRAAENIAKWRANNREKIRQYGHKRRAKKNNSDGNFTAEEFNKLCEKYGNKCLRCGRADVDLTADHVIPLTWEEATNDISNIQPLCQPCNSAKGNRHATDYRTDGSIKRWKQKRLL